MRSDVVIYRAEEDDQGTPGQIIAPAFSCLTLELPYRDNKHEESCIPEGVFDVEWTLSPRLKIYTYEILNVTGRPGIRMHGGNYAGDKSKGFKSDSLGCPLLGRKRGTLLGQKALLVSQPTVKLFESAMKYQPFRLTIKRIKNG